MDKQFIDREADVNATVGDDDVTIFQRDAYDPINMSLEVWDRLVAWVDAKRKEADNEG